MINAGQVIWELDVDTSKFDKGMADASAKAKDFGNKISNTFKNIASDIKSSSSNIGNYLSTSFKNAESASNQFAAGITVLGASIGGMATLGLKTAGEFETMTTALETVTGSSTQAVKAMETIKRVAKESPFFEVQTLGQFVQKMVAAGQTIDEAVASGVGFGDVAAAFGRGNAELERLGNTLTQVIGKGKADAVDFKELVNSGWVSVRKDVAESMGVSMSEFENMVSNGIIGYDEIAKASQKYFGSAQKQSQSLNSLFSRLRETVSTAFANIVIETGLFDAAKVAINGLIVVIESIDPQQIKDVFNFLKDNLPIITGAIIGGLIPSLIAMAFAFAPLIPFILIGTAIGIVAKIIYDNWGLLVGLFNTLQTAISNIINFFTTLFTTIYSFGVTVINVITMAFSNLITIVTTIFTLLLNTIITIFTSIIAYITPIMVNIYNAIVLPLWNMFQWVWFYILEPLALLFTAIFLRIAFTITTFIMQITMFFITGFTAIYNFFVTILNFIFQIFFTIWNNIYNTIILPVVTSIQTFLQATWETILAFTTSIYEAIKEVITQAFKTAYNTLQGIVNNIKSYIFNTWNNILGFLQSIGNSIFNALVEPFRRAKAEIEKIGNAIKDAANKINPFHRESPSLVDNVTNGIDKIIYEYKKLNDLEIASINAQMPFTGQATESTGVTSGRGVTVNIGEVRSQQDVDTIAREIGYRLSYF